MKKLFVFLSIITLLTISSGLAQADSWLTTPLLGYDSFYNGDVNIISGPSTTVIPHSFLSDDPLYGTGSPSMSIFTVGQEVHTGSGAFLDAGVTYDYNSDFYDLTNPSRNKHYTGTFTSDGFWMTWNTPDGGGDGLGLSTLTLADVGNWNYVETYLKHGTGIIFSGGIIPFTVTGVPEPATILLLSIGLVGLIGAGQVKKREDLI